MDAQRWQGKRLAASIVGHDCGIGEESERRVMVSFTKLGREASDSGDLGWRFVIADAQARMRQPYA